MDQIGYKIEKRNWGDEINYHLVAYLSGKKVMCINSISLLRRFHFQNYACIGSIIDDYYLNKGTIVWGSGCMSNNRYLSNIPNRVVSVRGPLTREILLENGVKVPEIYGDPALLLPYIYDKPQTKRYRCGLVPHVHDFGLQNVISFKKRYKDEVAIIDLRNYTKWTDVIDVIRQCDFIISSSLHGIIVSDAYGIPNRWIKLSENRIDNGFKFWDYYLSVKRKESPAVDYIGKEIDMSEFTAKISDYKKPEINLLPLIESCPFIGKKRLEELKLKMMGWAESK